MLESLIKEDFVDPDPDDGGQLRYEMEKLKVQRDEMEKLKVQLYANPPLPGSPFELQNRINTILEFLNKLSEADKLKIKEMEK